MNINPQLTPLRTLFKTKAFYQTSTKNPILKDARCKRTAVRLYPS
ncbi:hypothetical protein N207_01590 [Helicobacter pylori UM114]|uniref:Uncharacterized protein n=1 Tax=Helicobacter pylori UM114 TaxID=1355531 RepID=T0ETE1_HELPX|nr:hypothetical protein N207_01590 [Helicobacter pylori UM114]